jgi:hypothetical protein
MKLDLWLFSVPRAVWEPDKLVIPAGNAEIQKPGMVASDLAKHYLVR